MCKEPCEPSTRQVKLQLEELAKEIFETERQAAKWLGRQHPMLNGETPCSCAKSSCGAQRVKDILLSIKYGSAV